MGKICSVARFRIHDGKVDEFKRLSANCMRLAREKDTGTLRYELAFNADETECLIFEEFVDSAACVQHFQNMGENAAAIFAIVDGEGDLWGHPSAELRAGLDAQGVHVFTPYLSLDND